ncbi:hypothetical protein [Methylobacterium oryzihabitans]|uniref:Uncharacterized protein n=1 Tax=Methylobacterium oryzihabitans TaxID=2499852 RepID=A0A437NZK8_9HYPH|nr:hypothetical protein [Methylobacterium oryzihabitans]RVU15455.1 hypothetical protein EOE48_19495 [Methylobacterium oryzihabitans]
MTPIQSQKGDPIAEIDAILCLFDRKGLQPEAGVPVEVMISHAPPYRWHLRYAEMSEEKGLHPPTIAFLILRPITTDDVLIEHEGFECAGSMARASARVTDEADARLKREHGRTVGWLAPGRTPVIEASNVNAGSTWGIARKPLTPGTVYVSLSDLREGRNRVTGIPDLEPLDPRILGSLYRRRVAPAASRRISTDRSRRGGRGEPATSRGNVSQRS